jgi:hypothetical protein
MTPKQILAVVALIGVAMAGEWVMARTALAGGNDDHQHHAEMRVKDRHPENKTTPTRASVHGVRISSRGKLSLAPLPVDIYVQQKEKPTVAFTTPCMVIGKMSQGFPPIIAFETAAFQMISNVNDSNVLPAKLEPVCR